MPMRTSARWIEHLDLKLDRHSGEAFLRDRPLNLTLAEFRLLECLVVHAGNCLSREQLLDALTGGEAIVGKRAVDVHICTLRRKLGRPELIQTVRKKGYVLGTGTGIEQEGHS